jgi:hypothetical protein
MADELVMFPEPCVQFHNKHTCGDDIRALYYRTTSLCKTKLNGTYDKYYELHTSGG